MTKSQKRRERQRANRQAQAQRKKKGMEEKATEQFLRETAKGFTEKQTPLEPTTGQKKNREPKFKQKQTACRAFGCGSTADWAVGSQTHTPCCKRRGCPKNRFVQAEWRFHREQNRGRLNLNAMFWILYTLCKEYSFQKTDPRANNQEDQKKVMVFVYFVPKRNNHQQGQQPKHVNRTAKSWDNPGT